MKRHRFITRAGAASLLALMMQCAAAHADVVKKDLHFRRGASSATVQGQVAVGTQDRYEFIANANQTLRVSISSPQHNAVFGLYIVSPYGYQDLRDANGDVSFLDAEALYHNRPIDKARHGRDLDRRRFAAKLLPGSKSGKESIYAIVVRPTRGAAHYTLRVSIR